MDQDVRVTLRKSLIGATARQKEAARCLSLRKIGSSRVFKDTPAMRGQVKVIRHLTHAAAAPAATAPPKKRGEK